MTVVTTHHKIAWGDSYFVESSAIVIKSVDDFDRIYKILMVNSPDRIVRQMIEWLFHSRCIICREPYDDVNEMVPRSREKNALDWRNRVTLCRKHHEEYHHTGVTGEKLGAMMTARSDFLRSVGRDAYI